MLFSPPSTSSDTDPADLGAMDFPLYGHGSIALGPLFNDPDDKE